MFIFLFLIKTLKSIENYKKSDFWCKIFFFSYKRWFNFKSTKSPKKNIEKKVIYAVLEKNKYIVVKKDKRIKIGNLCNFREKKYCRDIECIFLVFFQQMKI